MAGPYYVDIDAPAAWNGKTGLDTTTNALLGLSGLQYLLDTITVGNGPIYVKGATGGDVAKLKTIASTTSLVGVFVRGEGVTWDAGASTGVVSEIATNAPTVIEVLTGTLANPDSLVGTTSGATCDVNGAIAQKGTGIDIDTNAGTNQGGFIKIIGCADDASYTVNDSRAIINGNGAAAHVVQFTGTADHIWLANLEVKNTAAGTYHGFYASSAQSAGLVFINCCANTCGARGFSLDTTNASFARCFRCVSYSNGTFGFYMGHRYYFCVARDNTTDGFCQSYHLMIGCVSHGNSDDGIDLTADTPVDMINCVIDGNTDDGVVQSTSTVLTAPMLLGCRITNHSGSGDIGLNPNSCSMITAFCYFEDNDGDNIQNAAMHDFIPIVGGSTTSNVEDQADTNEGYVDKTNHDFSTNYVSATDPHARRMAITLPWS
jgi:hypothetical protein